MSFITDHSHIVLIILKNYHWDSLCKIYGHESDDSAILFEHVIIKLSQLLALLLNKLEIFLLSPGKHSC